MVKLTVEGDSKEETPKIAFDSPSLSGKPDVACVVVNWSTPDDLKRCIDSAFQVEGPMYWSIYQNHHTDDDLMKRNHRATTQAITGRSSWTVCQKGKLNHGHGYGTNRGAEIAIQWFKPKYLFLVNPDCLWVEPVIDQLVEFLELHPKAALVGPKQMNSKRKITAGGIEGTRESPKHRFWHASDVPNVKARDSILSPNVAGSAILIRTEVFQELGGMLESGHYYSETWLCYHAQAHGYETWYYGQPWMIHEWHQSSKVGAKVAEGQEPQDRALFRAKCDSHDPPIPHN